MTQNLVKHEKENMAWIIELCHGGRSISIRKRKQCRGEIGQKHNI